MINHAIGAKGVVSQECKAVVEQYGQTIIDLLLSQVGFKGSPCYLQLLFSVPGQVLKLYIHMQYVTGTPQEDMLPSRIMHV